jgi:hypothetical protein
MKRSIVTCAKNYRLLNCFLKTNIGALPANSDFVRTVVIRADRSE